RGSPGSHADDAAATHREERGGIAGSAATGRIVGWNRRERARYSRVLAPPAAHRRIEYDPFGLVVAARSTVAREGTSHLHSGRFALRALPFGRGCTMLRPCWFWRAWRAPCSWSMAYPPRCSSERPPTSWCGVGGICAATLVARAVSDGLRSSPPVPLVALSS